MDDRRAEGERGAGEGDRELLGEKAAMSWGEREWLRAIEESVEPIVDAVELGVTGREM